MRNVIRNRLPLQFLRQLGSIYLLPELRIDVERLEGHLLSGRRGHDHCKASGHSKEDAA